MSERSAPAHEPVTRKELCWAVAVALAALVLAQAPYVLAYLTSPADLVFSGALFNIKDANTYLSVIRQGMEGSWLFQDRFTPEPHQAGPLYLPYTGLGQVARMLGISQQVAFHLARFSSGLVLLAAAYWLLSLVLSRQRARKTAFLLICFASGLGWLALLYPPFLLVVGGVPIDLWMPEATTFFTLLGFPHFSLATGLMLAAFAGLLHTFRGGHWKFALTAALGCFALAWVHPFNLPIVYAALAAYLLWEMAHNRRVLWRHAGQLALCLVPSGLALLYLWWGVVQPNPVFRIWAEQSRNPSPKLLPCLVGYGLLLPLALAGVWQSLRKSSEIDPLPLCWAAPAFLLLYTPFAFQRRFLEGLHIPLCVLAAVGLQALRRRGGERKLARPLLRVFLITGLATSTALVWSSSMATALGHLNPYFIHRDEADALVWLAEHSLADDTVLAAPLTGNFVPAWAGNRVVIGQWAATVHFQE